jgi:NTP pyrophosphatase (non-canonical NTP hydrolase)
MSIGKVNSSNYVQLATNTESPVSQQIIARFSNPTIVRLNHAAQGMCTEAGEFLDVIKKHIYYGKPIDFVNLAEEIGDLLWYCGIACDALGVSLEDVMQKNIEKLAARYPDKFSEDKAINRNLSVERNILEGNQ